MFDNCITVKQLNLYVKSLLEGDARLMRITVKGELSDFKNHYASGHWYFTLKDSDSLIRCVMFRSYSSRVKFTPCDGLSVVLTGRVSLYEKDGQYQFYAEEMHGVGEGDLALAFKEVKDRLQKEGLFDEENKRPICKFPKKIAVVTSDTGAAIEDIKNISARRYPICTLLICPVAVQGEMAVPEMLSALDMLYKRDDIDTVIIGRGGGSEEDLAAFNDEKLARKIYESPFPVISAVGHETDFSISDFVADLRAPTPSAAAELALPDINEIFVRIKTARNSCISAVSAFFADLTLKTEKLYEFFNSDRLLNILDNNSQRVDLYYERLCLAADNCIVAKNSAVFNAVSKLDALSPLKTLARGYAVVNSQNGRISKCGDVTVGDSLKLTLADGEIDCVAECISLYDRKGNN